MDGHAYQFPITDADRERAMALIEKLWNEPLEGFMALHNLQEDGNFKPANMVTQLFAQLHYHIRGTMVYEGDWTVKDFDNNIYKLSPFCS